MVKRRHRPQLESLEGRSLLSALSSSLTANPPDSRPGQPVVFTFQETNVSAQPVSVAEGPSTDGFVVQQEGKTVWQSNSGIQPMFEMLDTLQPGQSLTLTATWDGKTDDGSAPASGTFTVFNQLAPQATTTVALTNTAAATPHPVAIGTDPVPLPAIPVTAPASPAVQSPAGSPTTSLPQDPAPVASQSPIVVTVATDRARYRRGHRVRFTLTLQNQGNSAVTLPIDSAQTFTLLEGSGTIWRTARVISGVGSVTLQPGQSVDSTATWNGKIHPRGLPVKPGTYTIEASAWGYSGSSTFRVA